MHSVDLGESFQTHIFLQNVASIQLRTSPFKFAPGRSAQVLEDKNAFKLFVTGAYRTDEPELRKQLTTLSGNIVSRVCFWAWGGSGKIIRFFWGSFSAVLKPILLPKIHFQFQCLFLIYKVCTRLHRSKFKLQLSTSRKTTVCIFRTCNYGDKIC